MKDKQYSAGVNIRILALCATYNRKSTTLASLQSLAQQDLPNGASLTLALVDDASMDGTVKAIKAAFPEALTVNCGGEHYWAGAMRFGFSRFWNPAKYTHLLVFNDDCVFFKHAIAMALTTAQSSISVNAHSAVVVGAVRDPNRDVLTYGGLVKKRWLPGVYFKHIHPNGRVQEVDTLNMNFALIDATTLASNTLIGPHFTHSFADFDFGLRVKRRGVTIRLCPDYVGTCPRNEIKNTWEDRRLPFSTRQRLLLQPKGLPLHPRFVYLKSHAPFAWPLIFIWPYLRFYTVQLAHSVRGLFKRY